MKHSSILHQREYFMASNNNAIDLIGHTPLIKLTEASKITGCQILGKAEFLNPGGSIKDRAALGIIRSAKEKGLLKDGGTIVEGTAGNTGIGLTMVGNILGHPTLIVMPETQSAEKISTLKAYGAQVELVKAVPYKNPENYVHVSQRRAEELNNSLTNGAYWANQFDNTDNSQFHLTTTGPEIWQQTDGSIDGFVCAAGTGGTICGVGLALKKYNENIKVALSDPTGSGLYNYYANGKIKVEGSSITEGIGNSRITENLKDAPIDYAYQVTDTESLPWVYQLLKDEGLCLGPSSGVNIAGAIRLAKHLGPGHTIVTILCDSGMRYQGKLFNKSLLEEKQLPVPNWL